MVDDLHWCDGPSLRFVSYLVRRLEGLPVLVACTLRPAERRPDGLLVAEIAGDPLTRVVRPGPLSGAAATRLVRARLGQDAEPAFASACHAATRGNPLLLGELLKTLDAEGVRPAADNRGVVADLGPRAAQRAVLVRLARVPDAAVRLARAAAILGDGAELALVAALAGLGEAEAAEAATALVRTEVLRPDPPLGFVHPLVGAAVVLDMPPVDRQLQHERAAQLLSAGAAPVDQVAAQLLQAPVRGAAWAVDALLTAGRSAVRRGAADSAVAYLARALREPPAPERRTEVLFELGRAEALTSGRAATAHLQEAYGLLDEPPARALAAHMLARALLFTGRADEAAAFARRAAAELPPELADDGRALEAFELWTRYMTMPDAETLRRMARHRSRPPAAGVGAKMLAIVAAQEWANAGGPCDACAGLVLAALRDGELLAADAGLFGVIAISVVAWADREEAIEAADAASAEAHRRGSLFTSAAVGLLRAFIHFWRGELVDAEEQLRAGAGDGRAWGVEQTGKGYSDATLSAVLRERGDLAGARAALAGWRDPGDAGDLAHFWLYHQLELVAAEGRWEEAAQLGAAYAQRFAHLSYPIDAPWRAPTAVALDRLGRHEAALALAAEELELARGWGAPGTVARAQRVLGTLAREPDRLREAVALAAASPAKLEHAKARLALGAALRRDRRASEARDVLRGALELAAASGADGLAREARTELHAAGGRPRRTALSGAAALTASERRVADLAAGGQSNREIAQTLFVTPKTVDLHLRNAYRKLGIRRWQRHRHEWRCDDPAAGRRHARSGGRRRGPRAALGGREQARRGQAAAQVPPRRAALHDHPAPEASREERGDQDGEPRCRREPDRGGAARQERARRAGHARQREAQRAARGARRGRAHRGVHTDPDGQSGTLIGCGQVGADRLRPGRRRPHRGS